MLYFVSNMYVFVSLLSNGLVDLQEDFVLYIFAYSTLDILVPLM